MNGEAEIVGDFTFLPRWTPVPYLYPGVIPYPFTLNDYPCTQPAGHWEWVSLASLSANAEIVLTERL